MDYAIYNYLTPNFTQKPVTKYDAHKKSELKEVVNNILNISKHSPVYLVRLSEEKQNFALGVKEAAMDLQSVLEELQDDETENVFAKKKAWSNDTDTVTAKIVSNNYDRLPDAFEINVERLAVAQRNEGAAYYPTGVGLAEGIYHFAIDTHGSRYEFQYNIRKGDTHQAIMQGIADFINRSDVGILASVDQTGASGKMALTLQNRQTGVLDSDGLSFRLEDQGPANGQSGLVNYYQLNHVAQYPENAVFRMDGARKESQSNSFILNQSLNLTLHKTTDEKVKIGYGPDEEKILEGIQGIIDAYNSMLRVSERYAERTGLSPKLAREMKSIMRPYEAELESSGIMMDAKGGLSLDKSLASQSIAEGDLQKLFSEDSELIKKLSDKVAAVKLDPMEYVDKIMVSYPNTGKPAIGHAYITSMYSGMLFSYYC